MDYATFLQSVRRAIATDHPDSPRSDEAVLNDLCEAYRRQATALLRGFRASPLGPGVAFAFEKKWPASLGS